MEMDRKIIDEIVLNTNYLTSRCRLLENRNSRLEKRLKGNDEYIEVHDERIKELEHQLKHKDEYISRLKSDPDLIVEYEDKIAELNKELEITEKARVKWKDRCENLEERIKELEEERDNYKQQL